MTRRSEVFAGYARQRDIGEGIAPDVAKWYSLWLAKKAAARRRVLDDNLACESLHSAFGRG